VRARYQPAAGWTVVLRRQPEGGYMERIRGRYTSAVGIAAYGEHIRLQHGQWPIPRGTETRRLTAVGSDLGLKPRASATGLRQHRAVGRGRNQALPAKLASKLCGQVAASSRP
jgi:hypothetical protein